MNYGEHFCGGVIISPLHIITAAHCIRNSSKIIKDVKAVVGIDRLSQVTSSTAQVRSIVHVISHPQYNSYSFANDIAVLRLHQPLNISKEKGTAQLCFPLVDPIDMAKHYPFPDSSLVAIGWGKLASEEPSIPIHRHLQQVTLNAISPNHPMCRSTIHNRQLQFCAGVINGIKGACQGGSGGAVMYFEPNERRWILAGLASYGIGCGHPAFAGVYTRASVYYDWLRSIVTDSFIEFRVDGTNSTLTDSARNILSSFWLFAFPLYVLANK